MKRVLAEGSFLLAVLSAVAWLGSWVAVAALSVFGGPSSERIRKIAELCAMGGELPVLVFGWLYCQFNRQNSPSKLVVGRAPTAPTRPTSTDGGGK